MKSSNTVILIGLIAFLLTACSPKMAYFTKDLYQKYDWSERELERIQFYLSHDIVLRRQLGKNDSKIEEGKIRIKDGKQIEEVIIPKGTPGLLIELKDKDKFSVSFEDGRNPKTLMFGPNPKLRDRYSLLAYDRRENRGRVKYGDKTYVITTDDALASLQVDLRRATKVSVKSHTAKGRKID